jgi:hypothetical protein
MLTLEGLNGESIVLDGEWIEKLRLGNSRARNPISSYSGTQTNEFSRRKKILFGEKEHLLQVVVSAQNHMALTLPADRKADVDAFVSELEKAKAAAG